jgi:hypothetical protein
MKHFIEAEISGPVLILKWLNTSRTLIIGQNCLIFNSLLSLTVLYKRKFKLNMYKTV